MLSTRDAAISAALDDLAARIHTRASEVAATPFPPGTRGHYEHQGQASAYIAALAMVDEAMLIADDEDINSRAGVLTALLMLMRNEQAKQTQAEHKPMTKHSWRRDGALVAWEHILKAVQDMLDETPRQRGGGYSAIDIQPDLTEGMWPDLADRVSYANSGRLERIAAVAGGTDTGKRAVALVVRLPTGDVVIGETTLSLFVAAARALVAAPANAAELGEPVPEQVDWSTYPRGGCDRNRLLSDPGDLALFLGGDRTSFTGDLIRLIAKAQATPENFAPLARAFPAAVTAWIVWQGTGMPIAAGELADALAALSGQ